MKTLYRTLVILFFTAIVVAIIYTLGASQEVAQSASFERGPSSGAGFGDRAFQPHFEGTAGSETMHHERLGQRSSAFAALEFLRTLIPITIIVAVVSLIRKIIDIRRRKRIATPA